MMTIGPVMSEERFARETVADNQEVMTVQGTIVRAAVLLVVLLGGALWPWHTFFTKYIPNSDMTGVPGLAVLMGAGVIGGLVLSLIISFLPKTAPYLAVPYAFCEGVFMGAVSAQFEVMYKGIVFQAIVGTFGVLMVLLSCYSLGLIRATRKLRAVLLTAGIAIGLFYLVSFGLMLFKVQPEFMNQILFGNGWLGIGFSVIVCVVAALYLILDFDMVEKGAAMGAPKYMSWYAAFGLLVTLVWLYLEILRLLAKTRSRD